MTTLLQSVRHEQRAGAPAEGWVMQNRAALLAHIRSQATTQTTSPLRHALADVSNFFRVFNPRHQIFAGARMFGFFALMVGALVGGGFASAAFYQNTVPGQSGYGIKLAVEKMQLALVPNAEYNVRLHLDFTERRLDELALISEASATSFPVVTTALGNTNQEISALQRGLEKVQQQNPNNAVELAKLLQRKVAVYQNVLVKVQAKVPGIYTAPIVNIQDSLDQASLTALAIIVQKNLAGDIQAPQAVVQGKVEDSIQRAEAKLNIALKKKSATTSPATPQSTKTADQAKSAIAAAKELVSQEKYQAALLKITEVANLTKQVDATSVTPSAP